MKKDKFNDFFNKISSTKNDYGFYKFNKATHILLPIPKSKIHSIYIKNCKLLAKNTTPKESVFVYMDKDIRKILSYENSSDGFNVTNIAAFCTSKIKDIKAISVNLFNLSPTYMGICFDLLYNENIVDRLNELIESMENGSSEKVKDIVNGKKKNMTLIHLPDDERLLKIENLLYTIKMKALNFLIKSYGIKKFKPKMIFLDEYITSKEFNFGNRFLSSHGYLFLGDKNNQYKIKTYNHKNEVDIFLDTYKTNILDCEKFKCRYRMLIKNNNSNITLDLTELTNIYRKLLKEDAINEFDALLIKKRNILLSINKVFCLLHKNHIKNLIISNKINIVKCILENIPLNRYEIFDNPHLDDFYKFLKNKLKHFLETDEKISDELNKSFSIRTNRNALFIAIISLLISIASIAITIFVLISTGNTK